MPQIRILGQSNPAATTETVLYTVPQGKYALISFLNIATISASTVSFRMGVSVGGGALATADYLYYDVDIVTKDAFRDSDLEGLRLEEGDEVRIYASTNELGFTLFGTEVGV